ncbi:alpha-1,2-mannosyltransferase [Amycolatopsis cihanbeyliensis]|uniref:Alpha-1,2-mannosyltransferase n=1 Tax=Amycolatopsis cihanbeyliensis TaxID=1128664 RepID=A0A542DIE5_AMYCI|nr:alpha-1,2-mannosyltransferase [Amycolatopsis cihanbeyliensis]
MLILLLAEVVIVGVLLAWKHLDGLDLEVYRLGADALLSSGDPYGVLPPTRDGTVLPFTYPPFAALAFAPLLVLPLDIALVLLSVVSVLALGAVIALCFAGADRRVWVVGGAALAVQAVALLSEPVRATLGFGQLNLLLMLLVGVDVLAPGWRYRGVLIGLAAAIKLTPAAFLLFFLLRKDFRAVVRAAVVFGGCALLAWLLAPSASVRYWTELIFARERVGDPGYIGNQSLRGLLARLGPPAETLLWVGAVLLVLAATVLLMRRALAAGRPVPAVLVCALGALLVSPVSWTHHWVWVAPVLGVLVWSGLHGGRTRVVLLLGSAAVAAVVFVWSPLWDYRDVWPIRESYVLVGLLLLGLLGLTLDDPLYRPSERGDVVRLDRREQPDA